MPKYYKENGHDMVQYTTEEIKCLQSRTDWKRVDAQTDEELEANAASDQDNPLLDEAFFRQACRMRLEDLVPKPKEKICLRVDREVLEYFRETGPGYQTRMNAALKGYVAARKQLAGS